MQRWLICDHGASLDRSFCLYDERSIAKLNSDPPRCVKHGAILLPVTSVDGMSRKAARKHLERED